MAIVVVMAYQWSYSVSFATLYPVLSLNWWYCIAILHKLSRSQNQWMIIQEPSSYVLMPLTLWVFVTFIPNSKYLKQWSFFSFSNKDYSVYELIYFLLLVILHHLRLSPKCLIWKTTFGTKAQHLSKEHKSRNVFQNTI